jgi:hypothetical protein
VRMKFRVFWDVAPCSHVEVDRHFRGAYCIRHEGHKSITFFLFLITNVVSLPVLKYQGLSLLNITPLSPLVDVRSPLYNVACVGITPSDELPSSHFARINDVTPLLCMWKFVRTI